MSDSEIWKRVGYIAGRLADRFPQHQVKTRSYDTGVGMVTEFTVWDAEMSRYIVDYTVTHAAIEDVFDVDMLVELIVRAAQRQG